MNRFQTLAKGIFNKTPVLEYSIDKTKYSIIYNEWGGPEGDDKDVIELNVGDDLEKAKEKARDLSIAKKKLVDVIDNETGLQIIRYIDGTETEFFGN